MGLVVAFCASALTACGGGERQDENEPEGEFPVEIVSAEFPAKQRLAQTSELRLTVANVGEEEIPDLVVTVNTENQTSPEAEADPGAAEEAESAEADGGSGEELSEQEQTEVEQALEEELQETTAEEETGSGTAGTETSADEAGTPAGSTPEQAQGAFSVLSEQADLAIPSRPVWILEHGYPREASEEAGEPPPGELSGSGGAAAAQTNTFSFGPLDPNATKELIWKVTPVEPGTYTVRYRIAAGLQGKAVAVTQDGSDPVGEFVVRITDVPPQTRVNDAGKVVPIEKGDIIGQAGTGEQKRELGE